MAKKAKDKKRARRERRFQPQSTHSPALVKVIGALGAMALGAGVWAQFGRTMTPIGEPLAYGWWVLAGGAACLGLAIWLGTSGEAAIRVGDAGIALEKGTLRRFPWHGVSGITWGNDELLVDATDDSGTRANLKIDVKSQPQAAAWIVKEATARVPAVVDLSESVLENLSRAQNDAGESLSLDPVQVVGKRCASSDKVIAYEPDARVCPRCERIYHKTSVPETCACGASLEDLRPKEAADA